MTQGDRLLVSELVAQYSVEPGEYDIFVEGNHDVAFFDWILRKAGLRQRARVYEIQVVDIPTAMLNRYGTRDDNNGRVITLARELQSRIDPTCIAPAICIADGEFDFLLNRVQSTDYLWRLDGTSPETYVLDVDVIDQFFSVSLGGFPESATTALSNVVPVLIERSIIRAANEKLGWGMSWIDSMNTCTTAADGSLHFNRDAFVSTYLGKSGFLSRRREFEETCNLLREVAKSLPPARVIRGHDIAPVMAQYIRPHLSKSLRRTLVDPATLESNLMGCLDASKLLAAPAIHRILERLTASRGD